MQATGKGSDQTARYCHFPVGILGQVWYLIVTIPDLCTLLTLLVAQTTLLEISCRGSIIITTNHNRSD